MASTKASAAECICKHVMQTQKGSNGYQYRIVCRNCDKLLFMIHKDVNYVQLAAVCDKLPRFLNRLNLGEGVLHAPAPATGDLGEGDVPAAPKDAHAHDEWEVIDAKKDDSATKPDCRIVRRALLCVAQARP